ncbi:MAG: hypothetical protein HOE53_02890 [Candidatus Magasanikbacteria bacterium]|jgi:hypothetical protein|nr:hypothetical protein [Candidatus Magasanikbacteria bacterium]
MNTTLRGLIFGLLVFVKAAVIVAIEHAISAGFALTTAGFIVNALLLIPITMILAKWYFKAVKPTTLRGLGLALDILIVSVLGAWVLEMTGMVPADMTQTLFSSWIGYASVAWILLLCVYAGFEFDGTYSKDA